jgi:hypothetical protein
LPPGAREGLVSPPMVASIAGRSVKEPTRIPGASKGSSSTEERRCRISGVAVPGAGEAPGRESCGVSLPT